MQDLGKMVREFAIKFGTPFACPLGHPGSINLQILRSQLIEEEFKEFMEANDAMLWKEPDAKMKAHLLKELADMVYVIYGYADAFNLPLDRAIELIHENNMSKLQPDGTVKFRDDGKVLKPDNYKPVDLEYLF